MWESVLSNEIQGKIKNSYLSSISVDSALLISEALKVKEYASIIYIVISMGHLSIHFTSYQDSNFDKDISIGISQKNGVLSASVLDNGKDKIPPSIKGNLKDVISLVDITALKVQYVQNASKKT